MSAQKQEIGFDPDALRLKYKAERDKRVRADGNDQYQEVVGDFAYFVDDPYMIRTLNADRLKMRLKWRLSGVVLAACWLRRACARPALMISGLSKRRRLWRHVVLEPLSGRFVRYRVLCLFPLAGKNQVHPAAEIHQCGGNVNYCHVIAEKYDLHANALMQTEVTGTDWDEDSGRWVVKTDRAMRLKRASSCIQTGR